MRGVRQVGVVGSAVVAVVIVAASMAWACTEYARIVSVSPGEASAGATVQVVGQGFTSANELRIADRVDSGKVAGRALAFVNTPNFSVAVEIPRELAPGEYYLVGYGYDDQGQVKGQFSVPLTVLPATSAPTVPSGTTPETGEPAPAPAPTAESTSTPGPVGAAPVTPSQATPATATAAPSSSPAATPAAADHAGVSESAVASSGAAVPVAGAGLSAATSGLVAGTAAEGQQGAVPTAAVAVPVGEVGQPAAPLAGVTNGLWGGFAPGEKAGFGLSTGEVPTAPMGGGAGVGMVVLGGGAVALLGAGAVAVAQRRRAKATA